MRNEMKKNWLYWTSRIIGIFMAAFITLFAFDSLSVLEFIIHLVPTIVLVGVLLVAWRWPLIGGPVYFAISILYLIMTRLQLELLTYVIMLVPILLAGVLFLREGITTKKE